MLISQIVLTTSLLVFFLFVFKKFNILKDNALSSPHKKIINIDNSPVLIGGIFIFCCMLWVILEVIVWFHYYGTFVDAAFGGRWYHFGDGNFSSAQNPHHSFSLVSNNDITLSIVDANGCSGSHSMSNISTFNNDFSVSEDFSVGFC